MKRRKFVTSSIILGTAMTTLPGQLLAKNISREFNSCIPSLSDYILKNGNRGKKFWNENLTKSIDQLKMSIEKSGYFLSEEHIIGYKKHMYLCPVKSLLSNTGLLFIDTSDQKISYYLMVHEELKCFNGYIEFMKNSMEVHDYSIDDTDYLPVKIIEDLDKKMMVYKDGSKLSFIRTKNDLHLKIA